MRLFISGEVPLEIKKEFLIIQEKVKKEKINGRWVKPSLSHLTLIFLGETKKEKLPKIKKILNSVTNSYSPFAFSLEKISAFPSPTQAKIIALFLRKEDEKIDSFLREVQKSFKKENIWFDPKPFIPHLTLCRLKIPKNIEKLTKVIKIKNSKFLIKEISLKQSFLDAQGPLYKNLKTFCLKQK
ncbi:MAG: RNA 2',3'-cyclic phosphodiesterase [Microgenomates group bacterium]